MTQLTLNNLHSIECIQGLPYYHPFALNLDRCTGSCNIPNDLSNIVCVQTK